MLLEQLCVTRPEVISLYLADVCDMFFNKEI